MRTYKRLIIRVKLTFNADIVAYNNGEGSYVRNTNNERVTELLTEERNYIVPFMYGEGTLKGYLEASYAGRNLQLEVLSKVGVDGEVSGGSW